MPDQPSDLFDRLGLRTTALDSIRFARGVVPNTTYAICISIISIAATGWFFNSHPEIALPIIGIIATITVIYLVGTWVFAHVHPDLALLGGAELLKLRQLEQAAKGMPQPPADDPIIEDPGRPPPHISRNPDAPDEQ
jgi:hypothetical protein